MNKTLIRAAAVVNIVAASLIYVACSGDDGKDGKDGCIVEKNPTTNLFDFKCDGKTVVSVNQEGAVAGPPGESCVAIPFSGGVGIKCGSGETYPLYNGQGGTGPEGACSAEPTTVSATGDQAINIRCVDSRAATIIVCPPGSAAPTGSTGLLLNDSGMVGKCQANGTISRSGDIAVLACGTAMFDPRKEFCQRTFVPRATASSRDYQFATINAQGTLAAGPYPVGASIQDANSNYNKTNLVDSVQSVILPLCGIAPATTLDGVAAVHKEYAPVATGSTGPDGSVYNAIQYCARNLVTKIGLGSYRYPATAGSNAGKPIPGGIYDNDPASPSTGAWSVRAKGTCSIDLADNAMKGTGSSSPFNGNINGYHYTTGGAGIEADRIARECTWIEALLVEAANTPPYVSCPEAAPVVAVDDIKCVNREAKCLYHSTIDNTCVVQEKEVSTLGTLSNGSPGIRPFVYLAEKTGVPSTYKYQVAQAQGSGITATPVGSRDGYGASPAGYLNPNGNLWSKACVTLTRTVYYAVNDPYMSNKTFKEAPTTASGTASPITGVVYYTGAFTGTDFTGNSLSGSLTNASFVEPPICENLTPVAGGTPGQITQEPVAFENAIACLNGTLSLDKKLTNGQPIGYDGTTWDKPLFCVQDGAGLNAYCMIASSSITDGVTCQEIDDLKKADGTAAIAIVPNSTITWSGSLCKINGISSRTDCEAIVSATRPKPEPVAGIVTAVWNSTVIADSSSALTGTPGNANHTGVDHMARSGSCMLTTDATGTGAMTKEKCLGLKQASYGAGTRVPGDITGNWIVASASGLSADACRIAGNTPGSVSADNCAWINGAAGTVAKGQDVSSPTITWVE